MAETGSAPASARAGNPTHHGYLAVLVCAFVISTAPTYADLEDGVIGNDRERETLRALVTTLRLLQIQGDLRGDLNTVSSLLDNSTRPDLVRASLRNLLPEVARLKDIRERFAQAKPQLRTLSRPRQERAPRQTPPANVGLSNLLWLDTTDTFTPSTQIWLEAHTDRSEYDPADEFDGFDADNHGFTLGVDFALSPTLTLGFSVGGGSGSIDSQRLGADDVDANEYALSLSYSRGSHAWMGSFAVSDSDIDRLRVVPIVTENTVRRFQLRSNFESRQTAYGLGYSYFWDYSARSAIAPFVTFNLIESETEDYIERGGDTLGLEVTSEDVSQPIGSAGITWSSAWLPSSNWLIAPSISLSFEHDFSADSSTTQYRFINIPRAPRLRIDGSESEENRWRFDAGLTFMHERNVTIGINYQTYRKADYRFDAAIMNIQLPL